MNGDVPRFGLLRFKTLIRDARGPANPVAELLHTQDELDAHLGACQDGSRPSHAGPFG